MHAHDEGYKFLPDGTFEHWVKGSGVDLREKGTYVQGKDALTLSMRERRRGARSEEDLSKQTVMSLKWLSPNDVVVEEASGKTMFRRRKPAAAPLGER
jgi:hypothetical protein